MKDDNGKELRVIHSSFATIEELIEEIRYLRDETNHPTCDEDSPEYTTQCICARFDWVIDNLQAMITEDE